MKPTRRDLILGLAATPLCLGASMSDAADPWLDARHPGHRDALRAVTDRVMGGVSRASLAVERVEGRLAWHLSGTVSLDNNGGFVQMSTDVPDAPADWRAWRALRFTLYGDGGDWFVSLRTPQVRAPWQSWRAPLPAAKGWHTVDVPFDAFEPHRMSASLDWRRVSRMGLIAVGEARTVDLAVASVERVRG